MTSYLDTAWRGPVDKYSDDGMKREPERQLPM